MLFGQDRDQMRRFYCEVWRKHQSREPLEPMEQILAETIVKHPEYQTLLDDPESALQHEAPLGMGVDNPFLHMGMHIALHEQVSTDRPAGIGALYRALLAKASDAHDVEHKMMECLGDALFHAQQSGTAPDDVSYLECIKKINT
ncbi:hypothetical protein BOW53_07275 [Solemya pervernicosa gill symbiont]|uniref:DUF1841 domain-containing protein n=2 Tax=Gammaproteobacteria incertae sedis TaxID=118884 RepID=A0A1T2L662_9GAMM|nr:DUF1841 family protein [Candidatus Reidiella endopervernicosa]OOZ40573.1 hypothetical protein BOW53_07275 [Solemya pervernicosa gill symbiont]QKQ27599.1 DUF1841 family protein [Candidatus Reidiella endopervernicosa]